MCDGPEFNPKFRQGCGCSPPFFGKEIAGMIQGIVSQMKNSMGSFEGWVPYDIEELEDCFKIIVPLPGLAKENVKVSLINGCLNISTTKPESEEEEGKNIKSEKYRGKGTFPFVRSWFSALWDKQINLDVPLPPAADENNVKSAMKNGLLKIKIGKKPAKKIDINDNNTGENK